MHAELWHDRLRDEPRFREARSTELWPFALGTRRAGAARGARGALRAARSARPVERGDHAEGWPELWDGDDRGAPLGPGRGMVTAEAVWSALAELEDPEIPVISLVDLGVVRDVRVDGERVRVEFTPTFLGCPALEVMRDQMTEAIEELGGEAEVEVVMDDSWSTDKITPEGREKLRAAGFAPPAPREAGAPKLVQLQSARLPLPVLRLDRDEAGEHLRPDPVPVDPLLRELPPAVRAVQDDLVGVRADPALDAGLRIVGLNLVPVFGTG